MKIKSLQLKRTLISVLLVLLLSAAGMGKMDAQNLIVNGDFEQTSGFNYQTISDYTRIWGGGVQQGQFIHDNTSTNHGIGGLGWPANLTGYGGSGYYLLFNGFGGSQSSTKRVWWQQVNVTTQTTYTFKCYVRNLSQSSWLFNVNPSIIQVKINGSAAGNNVTLDVNNYDWVEITRTWNSGNVSGPIDIEIFDVYTGNPDSGDDFGIDHISFIPNVLYDVTAQDDYVTTALCLNDYVDVDVLQNDNVLPNTNDAQVQVLTNPVPHGTAQVLSNKKIRYTFTDSNYDGPVQFGYRVTIHGVQSDATVHINTARPPQVGNITAPPAINAGGSFNLTPPIINGSSILGQGWQIAATQNGSYTPFINNNVPYSCNGYWIRYFADNDCGVGYSNAVQITVYQNDNNITFADANVKAICVANWDTNGDGELSYAEAAAVTDLGQVFRENTTITSFEELQYFTGLATISDYAFYSCSNLSGSLFIPNSVTTIGDYAFMGCQQITGCLTIPNSVTTIGNYAFAFCHLLSGSLTIPNSVITIGEQAFSNCQGFTGSLTIGNSVTTIASAAFIGCIGFTGSLTIPNSVTSIGYEAFYNCSGLAEVYYNAINCADVPLSPFIGCSGLLSIGESVERIPAHMFQDCNGFTGSLTIPNSVTSIGYRAFENCTGFSGVIFNATNCADFYKYYIYSPFNGCIGSFTIGESVERIPAYMFKGCNGFTGSLTIPNSVTSIGEDAFKNCSGFTGLIYNATNCADVNYSYSSYSPFNGCVGSLIIGENVERIPAYMFKGCNGFTGGLTIPNSVTMIGDWAFYDCSGMTSLTISNSVITIGNDAFMNCSGFTGNVTIPDSLTEIGHSVFRGCSGLASLTLPNALTSIGVSAFYGCSGLTSLYIPNSVTSIGEAAFSACSNLEQIIVGLDNVVYDSRENCNGIIQTNTNELMVGCKNTIIPNSVSSIGYYAFLYCTNLISIIIPDSVTTIGDYAFNGCSGLTSMTVLAETPPALGSDAFYDVNTSIPVYVPCSSLSAYQSAVGWNEFTNYMPATTCASGEITVTANPAEGGTVTGAGYYEGGTTCMLTATHNEGYLFLNWSKDGQVVSTDSIYSFIVAGDADFVACFAEEEEVCYITFELYDSYGDGYTGNYLVVTDENVSQQLTVESGSSAVYTLPFLTGSHITLTWIVGSYPEDCSFTVSYSNGNVIYHGENLNENFYYEFDVDCVGMPVSTFDVTAVANPIDGGTITGTGQYEYNATCTLTAIANEGYAFVNWTQGGTIVSNDVEYSFYVVDNVAVVANFIPLGNIDFVDANVKAICVANWDTNGDGELSYAEAAAVTNLGQVFRENMEITSFEELQYFTGLTTISDYAFYNCSNLSGSLYIPNSVTWIKVSAFYGCNGFIGNLTIPNSVIIIGDWAFDGCSGFTGTLSIPSSVTIIGHGAFDGCSGFTGSLTIPNSVTMIGFRAFYNCSGFTGGLTIPNSVTTIGSVAFGECRGFSGSLTIPNSVIEIDYNPFAGCTGIEQIMVEINNPRYDSRENCNAIIETNTFKLVSGCKNSVILNGVTSIGGNAFCGCSGLTGSLIIPNSVTSIDGGAFQDCSGLTGNLTIPNSVTTIGNLAFHGCEGFTGSLTIPNSVTTIGIDAFSGCSGLTGNLNIPNSVTSIGDNAFRNCSGFTGSLTIGNSVTSIGGYAFGNCSGFTEAIMYNSTVPSLGSNAFSFMPFPIFVPYESLNDYKTATNWNDHEYRIFPMAYTTIPGYGEGEGNYRFIASPLVENTTPTAVDNMITETAYDLYRFDQSEDDEWQNYKYPENTPNFFLTNGQGYLYANAEDVNLIFKGEFNEDDTKEVDLAYDANADFAGWNLVGNPFPVNAYANKSYYTMNEEGDAIEPTSVSSATAIPACTGVMVMAEAEGETVVFSTEAPEATTNQGCLQIELSQAVNRDGVSTGSTSLQDKAIVSFNAGDRLEKFVFNKENAVISIPQGGKELSIACIDKKGEVPLNFKATKNGEYTLTILPEAVELDYLHLIDNLTGADVDLLVSPAYTFTAKTTDYASRFRLVFSGNEADGPSTSSGTFAFINNGNIIITGAEADATLQIVDMQGRVVVSCGGHMRCVPTTGMAKGVYVLRLINAGDVRTQKIVVK